MKKYSEDREYLNIVCDILENEEFKKMETIIHHEGNRLDHSIRVSYFSYKLAKFLKLDHYKVARASLLHDFFLEENFKATKKERAITMVKHPEYALKNAKKYFDLSSLEEDIIVSHMFPIGKHIPKYFESWMVDIVDDIVAIYEESTIISKQFSTATCFLIMVLLNSLR
jgi:uncharacterized protein